MVKYKNLTIIGTSHIAIESIEEIKKEILENKPDIIALELDKPRFQSLMSKQKPKFNFKALRQIGLKGFLLNMIGAWVEKKLGETVGVMPGEDMKTAALLAKEHKLMLALIDQDISITLKKLSKEITWREKFRFFWDIIKSIVIRKPIVKFDLTKVPDEKVIKKLTDQVKKNYPTIHRILIAERNEVMAKNLYKLMQTDKNILAIVGAGHKTDIIKLIKKND